MKLAIMQPYLLPYLGYFQLIHAVDTFVVYDDVNFIRRGWINRNFILSQGDKTRITLQLNGASQNVLINQVAVGDNREKLLRTIKQSYAKAPYCSVVFPLLEEIIGYDESNLATFLDFGIRRICDYLHIRPKWYLSSNLEKDGALRGQRKILSICKDLGADHYVNVPGGKDLYDQAIFETAGIQLSFIESRMAKYRQFGETFVPDLSIVDIMMFNSQDQCRSLIKEYTLV